MRIETPAGVVWAKQGAVGAQYEGGLLEILAELCPDGVIAHLGLDVSSGRLLLQDGGPAFGDAPQTDGRFDEIATWEQVLRRYAALQRATEPVVDRLIARGVPDLRPTRIVDVVKTMLARDELVRLDQVDGLASWERTRLIRLLPVVAELARRADAPIAATVDHNDLHRLNLFARGLRIFDWGDAVIGHPFASLRRGLDLAATQPEPQRAPARARLERAYVEAWAGDVSPAALQDQLLLAPALGAIAAASTWTRLPAAAVGASPASFPRKMRELLAGLESWNDEHAIQDAP